MCFQQGATPCPQCLRTRITMLTVVRYSTAPPKKKKKKSSLLFPFGSATTTAPLPDGFRLKITHIRTSHTRETLAASNHAFLQWLLKSNQ